MKILICTDFSPSGQAVVNEAEIFLKPFADAEVHVYTVIDMAIVSSATVYNDTGLLSELEAEALQLKALAEKVFSGKIIQFSSEVGYPIEKILAKTKSQAYDLTILGTHGRTGLNHIVMGSVAENVLRHIKCNTLIIPLKHKLKAQSS